MSLFLLDEAVALAGAIRRPKKSKSAKCAAKAAKAERGTKHQAFRSCMTGKPKRKGKC